MSSVTEHYLLFSELFVPNRLITKMTPKTKQGLSTHSCMILGGEGGGGEGGWWVF